MNVTDKRALADILKEYILDLKLEEIEELIEVPPAEFEYTYAFPCFKISKVYKKNQI